MKVLLLFKPNMPIVNIQQNIIPNGLLYIGTLLLSKKLDVEVLNLSDKSLDECKKTIKEKNPDIVGISCYTFNRHTCVKLAEIVKEVNKQIKVVFGGPHSSVMHKQLLEISKNIDIVVLNEGEMTFLDIIQRLKEGKSFENLPGITYRNDNKIINNGFRKPLENLDELPIPAQYFKYKRIITSRGCPGRCIFCDTPYLWGQSVRLRSVANVVDELEMLNKKYGISFFIISDDTFTFDKDRTIGICKEIIKRNLKITWDCRSRVNLICEERLKWMKKAGCITVSYGIESGSQKILNNLKKGITVGQIEKAALLTRKFGFNLNYFIIAGSPGETDDTVRETMKLIEETKPTAIFTYIMQLTPGTKIYEIAKESNFISDIDWINKKDETIFYSSEKSLEELNRYVRLINELFRIMKKKFEYSEDELKAIKEKGVQDLINLAHVKMENKDFDEQKIKELGKEFPNPLSKAQDFPTSKSKNFEEAEKILDEAIQLNPGSPEALVNKAVILAMKKDEECIDFFNKAIIADPENLLAYKNLGLFLFKKARYNEAISIFKKAIETEPADVEFYNDLGSIYGMQNNYDIAIEMFEKALLIDVNNKKALQNLEITYNKKRIRDEI